MYTIDLNRMIESHGLSSHLYGDGTQVYGSCSPFTVDEFLSTISECVDDVINWASSNRLQLNPDKAEALWCATSRRQHQLPLTALLFASVPVAAVKSVRNMGIYIDPI